MRYVLAFLFVLLFVSGVHADAAVVTATTSVPANTDTTVSIPLGNWINAIAPTIIEIAGAVITAVVAWIMATLVPAALRQYINTQMIQSAEQLLMNAVNYGIAAVAGAETGRVLSVSVGNSVVAQALNYAITHGPQWLINWLGGPAQIEQKIIARLPLEAAAKVVTSGTGAVITPSPLAGQPSATTSPALQ